MHPPSPLLLTPRPLRDHPTYTFSIQLSIWLYLQYTYSLLHLINAIKNKNEALTVGSLIHIVDSPTLTPAVPYPPSL